MVFDPNLHAFHSPLFQSVVSEAIKFFVNTPVHDLPPEHAFRGTGVYAIYYVGSYSTYFGLADSSYKRPIYVGKAVPAGWRTARILEVTTGRALYLRLAEHARSINYTSDLATGDFRCRFIILENIERDLIVPVEAELIRTLRPLWNTVVDGFGNHDPGSGRFNQARSEWDVLHPGRPWTVKLTGNSPQLDNIMEKNQKIF